MEFRTLGTTGIKVSVLGLGTMMLGERGNPDSDDGARIIHRALDAGINLVDTADRYSLGGSEKIVGKALRGRRDEVVLSTKVGNPMSDSPLHRGGSRRWIVRAVEDSLRRLQTDRIDLYQVHRPDYSTPIDETLAALTDLVRAGKVLAIGSSTFPPSLVVEAAWVARRDGGTRFATEQPPYSLLQRGIERELLPTTQRLQMGTLVWSPLSQGWLTGRYRRGSIPDTHRGRWIPATVDLDDPANVRKLDAVERLVDLASSAEVSLTHLALAFAITHPGVTAALVGPRTLEQLEGQLGASELVLSTDLLDQIDAIVPPGVDVVPSETYATPDPLFDPVEARRR